MEEIAGYKIINKLRGNDFFADYVAKAPARIKAADENVTLRVRNRVLTESDYDKLVNHLATIAKADSPFVSTFYEVGQSGSMLYVSSELLPDGSLAKPQKGVGRADVVRIISSVANGLHALHEHGVAHCEVHSGNIFLADPAKVANPGILGVISPGQTLTGSDLSAPIEYKSPMYIQGGTPSRANDIWSCGVALHRALTGESIYPNLPTDSLLNSVRFVLGNRPTLSDALRNGERRIITKCLATGNSDEDPYISAAELASDLEAEAERQAAE